jgi:hypothetical protein
MRLGGRKGCVATMLVPTVLALSGAVTPAADPSLVEAVRNQDQQKARALLS